MSAKKDIVRYIKAGVSFGEKKVFENFSLDVDAGEKVCITGPSGIGKTTLLNLVLGFALPSSGEVEVMGKPVNAMNLRWIRSHTAWIPQDIVVSSETAESFLYLPFHFKQNKLKMPEKKRVEHVLEKLGLETQILGQAMASLSGGQKQRIAIASALLLLKPLMLIDEPTSALDHTTSALVAAAVLEFKEMTVISVSHDDIWKDTMDRAVALESYLSPS